MVSLITCCLDFDFDFVTSCFTNFVKTFQAMSRKKRMEDIVQKKKIEIVSNDNNYVIYV